MKKFMCNIATIATVTLFTSCSTLDNSEQFETSSAFTDNSVIEVTTDETSVSTEAKNVLTLFTAPEYKSFIEQDFVTVEWNNEELTELLSECEHIYTYYFKYLYSPYFNSLGYSEFNDKNYTRSGVIYESFKEYLLGYFTENCVSNLFLYNDELTEYVDINGELCYINKENGSNPSFDSVSFSIEKQTDDEIVIKALSRFWHEDMPDVENYQEFYYKVSLTPNGWRFDNFEDFRINTR